MDQLISYLSANRERFIQELCDYVRFPSVSAQPAHAGDLLQCAQWLQRHCKEIGLQTRLHKTAGNPILTAKTFRQRRPGRPHFLVYGHYDVQPPEPFELWKTPPFEPTIQDNNLHGRGSSDNKGQNFAHLKAVEAYLKTKTPLPCDITFLLEGEEEVGSASLESFLGQHREELQCDAVVISDTGMPSPRHPALTYGLRGVTACEVTLTGPSRDLHSGIFGGSVENPAMALCQMLASLRNKNGKITVPGFYDDVVELTKFERKELARLPHADKAYARFLGVRELYGEKGYTAIEQRSCRPTLEINGLTSGYQGEGSKTIVPSWARVKITCRLVPNQTPRKINALLKKHLKSICPGAVRMTFEDGHGGEPYLVSPESDQAKAALRALEKAFSRAPAIMREGGSIPIVNQFKKQLNADTLLLGIGLPDDNPHSPNEKFSLECLEKGMLLGVHLWRELCE